MSGSLARIERRRVDGVLLLDKSAGITSQSAVTRVRRLYAALKGGHTGTLDPMATGLLPIALGEATKFSGSLLDAPKAYSATIRLGVTTATGDLEGAEIARCEVPRLDAERLESVLARFRGEITQVPPMYSALKRDGKPLYEYARKGIDIERAPRGITISELALESRTGDELHIRVSCSKGTYVRVLAEDIGQALGCGACLSALRRTAVGHLNVTRARTLEALERFSDVERAARLLPVDTMLADLPAVSLDEPRARRIAQGMNIGCASPAQGLVRIYGPGERFIGVAQAIEDHLKPRRLIAAEAA